MKKMFVMLLVLSLLCSIPATADQREAGFVALSVATGSGGGSGSAEQSPPGNDREKLPAPSADEVLDALGDEIYRATYDAICSGEVIRKGSKGDAAKGVQQTLIAFGQDIAADGSVGPKTIGALNAVQAAFGMEQT